MNVWIQAARPKTLFVSIAPVIVAIALALSKGVDIPVIAALICLLFAMMAQIISNLANDYADFVKGADDEDRLGPKRMMASGLISKRSMLTALAVCTVIAGGLGLSLVYWGGWGLVPIGLVIFVAAYAYSAGPFPLSYHGLGDVAVLLFYGFVPVVFTYYVLCRVVYLDVCLAGAAMGLVADNLLIVNNYRDADQDKLHNKRTTVVLLGRGWARLMYMLNPVLAVGLGFAFVDNRYLWAVLGLVFIAVAYGNWRKLTRVQGSALNGLLGRSSMMTILFALMVLAAGFFPEVRLLCH